jgi:hypothetical protein
MEWNILITIIMIAIIAVYILFIIFKYEVHPEGTPHVPTLKYKDIVL